MIYPPPPSPPLPHSTPHSHGLGFSWFWGFFCLAWQNCWMSLLSLLLSKTMLRTWTVPQFRQSREICHSLLSRSICFCIIFSATAAKSGNLTPPIGKFVVKGSIVYAWRSWRNWTWSFRKKNTKAVMIHFALYSV